MKAGGGEVFLFFWGGTSAWFYSFFFLVGDYLRFLRGFFFKFWGSGEVGWVFGWFGEVVGKETAKDGWFCMVFQLKR